MPLHRARAEEELGADLRVRQAIPGEPGNLLFLGCELLANLGASLANLFAGCEQLAAGSLSEALHPDCDERAVSGPQLLTRCYATALAA